MTRQTSSTTEHSLGKGARVSVHRVAAHAHGPAPDPYVRVTLGDWPALTILYLDPEAAERLHAALHAVLREGDPAEEVACE